ncbi:hypothetical protein SERLA73DRAFT_172778, partial [Serpula lacrymans var. lacrymans S7.3]
MDNLNTMMHFLQLCLEYANDYVSLCECSLRETIVDSGASLRELIATAKQNVAEVNILSAAYEKTNNIFRDGRFNSLFRRRFSLTVTRAEQSMFHRSAPNHCYGRFSPRVRCGRKRSGEPKRN